VEYIRSGLQDEEDEEDKEDEETIGHGEHVGALVDTTEAELHPRTALEMLSEACRRRSG
jgi:glycine/D-amino acid oxidase-like deaminating enzyme